MYLTDMVTKQDKRAKVDYILSTVLKIKEKKNINDKEKDIKETVKFLSEQMLKEIEKAFK